MFTCVGIGKSFNKERFELLVSYCRSVYVWLVGGSISEACCRACTPNNAEKGLIRSGGVVKYKMGRALTTVHATVVAISGAAGVVENKMDRALTTVRTAR